MTQSPCEPPCWYGLELGQSNEQDVLNVLATLPFVEPDSIRSGDTAYMYEGRPARNIIYRCPYLVETFRCGELQVFEGKLHSMWYGVGYRLTMQTVVDLYGAPSFVTYEFPLTAETGGCALEFYWPEKGIKVGYSDFRRTRPCELFEAGVVDPDQMMHHVEFASQEEFEAHLELVGSYPWPSFAEED